MINISQQGILSNPAFRRTGNITYYGSVSVPADNGSNGANITLTPPVNMVVGDLVVIIALIRSSTPTISIGTTGGQSWTAQTAVSTSGLGNYRVFWCRYNGTWAADPGVTFSANQANGTTAVMHVFRPTVLTNNWAIDTVGGVGTDTTNPITITGFTPINPSSVSVALWAKETAVTYGSLNGSGWVTTGLDQYRNLQGSDTTLSFAHKIKKANELLLDVEKTISVAGGTQRQQIITFYEIP